MSRSVAVTLALRILVMTLVVVCLLSGAVGLFLPEVVDPDPDAGISKARTGIAVWSASVALGLADGYFWWRRRKHDAAQR